MDFRPTGHLAQVTKKLRTSSAVAPSLILTAICSPVSFGLAAFASSPAQEVFLGIGALPIVLTVLQATYFTLVDPDRLQNENHVENKMIIGRMKPMAGDSENTITIDQDAELSDNPQQIEQK